MTKLAWTPWHKVVKIRPDLNRVSFRSRMARPPKSGLAQAIRSIRAWAGRRPG